MLSGLGFFLVMLAFVVSAAAAWERWIRWRHIAVVFACIAASLAYSKGELMERIRELKEEVDELKKAAPKPPSEALEARVTNLEECEDSLEHSESVLVRIRGDLEFSERRRRVLARELEARDARDEDAETLTLALCAIDRNTWWQQMWFFAGESCKDAPSGLRGPAPFGPSMYDLFCVAERRPYLCLPR